MIIPCCVFLLYIFCFLKFFFFCPPFHHRSGSTQTIFFCSSQMMVRRRVSRDVWSHQESEATVWYRHGSLSSSGSSLLEHASSCSSHWLWRCSFDLELMEAGQNGYENKFAVSCTCEFDISRSNWALESYIERQLWMQLLQNLRGQVLFQT